jgi:hypothetical protein
MDASDPTQTRFDDSTRESSSLPHERCFEIHESNDISSSWHNASDILSGHSFEQAWRYVKAAVDGEKSEEAEFVKHRVLQVSKVFATELGRE